MTLPPMTLPPVTLRFEPPAWRTLVEAVSAAYPLEACGVCVSRASAPDVIAEVHALSNTAADPRRTFAFDDVEHLSLLREVEARGDSVRAFFHSHPDGEAALSSADLAHALVDGPLRREPLWPGVDWIVVATRGDVVREARRFTYEAGGFHDEGPIGLR